jgi:hypothetical protein
VLFRGDKAGVRYRLSEILYPRDEKIREANLLFNRDKMKNDLIEHVNEAQSEFKEKLKNALPEREKQQMKVLQESSMRLLLNDYLYFKSDLRLKSNERLVREVKQDWFYRRMNFKSVNEINIYLDKMRRQKEAEELSKMINDQNMNDLIEFDKCNNVTKKRAKDNVGDSTE